MRTFITLVGLMLFTFCGCMHTTTGGGAHSPDKRYRFWATSHGASGKAYVDKSKKKIWISIESHYDTQPLDLFQQRYILTGSGIEWKTRWLSDEVVSVVFYDWGDGVSNYSNMKHLPASNHIASLSFSLDRTTGKFVETK